MANNLSAFNSEQWSTQMVQKLDQMNIMLRLVNRNWEGDLRQNKTVQVRTPGNISMSSYTRGATVSYQDLTPTKESFTVNDGQYFAFEVDDLDRAQSDINALDTYSSRAVVALNNTIESKLLATYASAGVTIGANSPGSGAVLTPVISGGAVTSVTITSGGTGYTSAPVLQAIGGNGNGFTATCTVSAGAINAVTVTAGGNNYTQAPSLLITTASPIALTTSVQGIAPLATDIYNVFMNVRSVMSKQNVPMMPGARWAVIDPDAANLLFEDTAHFVKATDLGENIVQTALINGATSSMAAKETPGFIGMCAGFLVYESNHNPVSGSNRYHLFGNNDAISYASQITEMEMLRLQTTFADAVRGLLLHDTFVPAEASKRLVTVVTQRT